VRSSRLYAGAGRCLAQYSKEQERWGQEDATTVAANGLPGAPKMKKKMGSGNNLKKNWTENFIDDWAGEL
jgi:hypothetical protein